MHTPDNTYWLTKDGRKFLVANMDDDHVFNCVKMLTRKLGVNNQYGCSDKQRLCDLISLAKQEIILAALTDPNN